MTESLIKAGAFDSLGHPRKGGLFLVHAEAVESVIGTKKAEAIGQFDLFGGGDDAADPGLAEVFAVKVPEEEWDTKHKLAIEREMLGLYVSGHPLAGVEHAIAAHTDTSITSLLEGNISDGAQITIGGIISSVTRRVNKKGGAVGRGHPRGHGRWRRGLLLPARVRGVRDGHRGRQHRADQGPGQPA